MITPSRKRQLSRDDDESSAPSSLMERSFSASSSRSSSSILERSTSAPSQSRSLFHETLISDSTLRSPLSVETAPRKHICSIDGIEMYEGDWLAIQYEVGTGWCLQIYYTVWL